MQMQTPRPEHSLAAGSLWLEAITNPQNRSGSLPGLNLLTVVHDTTEGHVRVSSPDRDWVEV